jgi:Tol biopolymer transport system component
MDRLFYPSWFADGRHVVVTDYRHRQVLKVDVESGAATPLTDPAEVWAGMAAVSRDGRLAFAGQAPGGDYDVGDNRIWVLEPGGQPALLDGEHGRTPAWSADGSRLAYSSVRRRSSSVPAMVRRVLGSEPSSLFVAVWNGGSPVVQPVSPTGADTIHPKWAPKGQRIVCMARDIASDRSGIALLGV